MGNIDKDPRQIDLEEAIDLTIPDFLRRHPPENKDNALPPLRKRDRAKRTTNVQQRDRTVGGGGA